MHQALLLWHWHRGLTLKMSIRFPLFWSTWSLAWGQDWATCAGLAHCSDYNYCTTVLKQKCLKRLGSCFSLNCQCPKYYNNSGPQWALFNTHPQLYYSVYNYMENNGLKNIWFDSLLSILLFVCQCCLSSKDQSCYFLSLTYRERWKLIGCHWPPILWPSENVKVCFTKYRNRKATLEACPMLISKNNTASGEHYNDNDTIILI